MNNDWLSSVFLETPFSHQVKAIFHVHSFVYFCARVVINQPGFIWH